MAQKKKTTSAAKKSTANKSTTRNTASRKTAATKKKAPFYKKAWFWITTSVASLLLIGGIILALVLGGTSYKSIYEDHQTKIETGSKKIISEFEKDANANKKGSEGLNDLYENAREDINKLVDTGIDELDELKDKKSDSSSDEYNDYAEKLEKEGQKQQDELTKEYESDENYEKYSIEEKTEAVEEAISNFNDDELGLDLFELTEVHATDSKGVNLIEIEVDAEYLNDIREVYQQAIDEAGKTEEMEPDDVLKAIYEDAAVQIEDDISDVVEKPKFVFSSDGNELATFDELLHYIIK